MSTITFENTEPTKCCKRIIPAGYGNAGITYQKTNVCLKTNCKYLQEKNCKMDKDTCVFSNGQCLNRRNVSDAEEVPFEQCKDTKNVGILRSTPAEALEYKYYDESSNKKWLMYLLIAIFILVLLSSGVGYYKYKK